MSKRGRSKYSIGVSSFMIEHTCTCGYTTTSETGMKLHARITHKGDSMYDKNLNTDECEMCGKSFKNKKECVRHIKTFHRGK